MMRRFQVIFEKGDPVEVFAENESKAKGNAPVHRGDIRSVIDLGGYINPSQEWLDPQESAVYLGIGHTTLWEMKRDKYLPRQPLCTRAELDEGMRKRMAAIANQQQEKEAA